MSTPTTHSSLSKPGFTLIGWDELYQRFVEPVSSPARRIYLLQRLQVFLRQVEGLGLSVEVWFDGPWISNKPDPGEINLLLIFNRQDLSNLSAEQVDIFRKLVDDRPRLKAQYECVVYWVTNDETLLLADWEDTFSSSLLPLGPTKGIFKLYLNYSNA